VGKSITAGARLPSQADFSDSIDPQLWTILEKACDIGITMDLGMNASCGRAISIFMIGGAALEKGRLTF